MNLAGQKRAAPGHVVVRVIEYQVDGGEGQCCVGRSQRAGDWLGDVVGQVLSVCWLQVFAGGSSLGRPARAHAGPHARGEQIKRLVRQAGRYSAEPIFLGFDCQLAAAASRSPPGVAARSAAPNLDRT